MATATTEHSKALRAKTAAEWRRKQIAEGEKKQISVLVDKELADTFSEIGKELGLSKAKTLQALIDFYKNN